ncbi:MAG TPA: hypothetical protein VL286_02770, partial [Rhizomicrobium sp.]|nr:hypothetical protein [Rhizomicrobium sp.]
IVGPAAGLVCCVWTFATGAADGGASSWVWASWETGAALGVRCASAPPALRPIAKTIASATAVRLKNIRKSLLSQGHAASRDSPTSQIIFAQKAI